jgi:hypothetical protein
MLRRMPEETVHSVQQRPGLREQDFLCACNEVARAFVSPMRHIAASAAGPTSGHGARSKHRRLQLLRSVLASQAALSTVPTHIDNVSH